MILKRKIKRGNQEGRKIRRRADDSEGEKAEKDKSEQKRSPSSSADEADVAEKLLENGGESQKQQQDEKEGKNDDRITLYPGGLCFDEKGGVDLLLRNFRFLCQTIHRPKNELVTELPNVPVVLLPEQTQLLLENGFAKFQRIQNIGGGEEEGSEEKALFEPFPSPSFPQSVAYAVKLTVFRDLWRKGFYLADGAKFGCDYLAYRRPPPEQHSEFMVLCMDANANDGMPPLRPLSLIAVSRASTQVRKRILLAIVSVGSPVPYYLEMNWWKGDDE